MQETHEYIALQSELEFVNQQLEAERQEIERLNKLIEKQRMEILTIKREVQYVTLYVQNCCFIEAENFGIQEIYVLCTQTNARFALCRRTR